MRPETAFLGPRMWDQVFSLPLEEEEEEGDDFSVMNIDDFLSENNVDMEEIPEEPKVRWVGQLSVQSIAMEAIFQSWIAKGTYGQGDYKLAQCVGFFISPL